MTATLSTTPETPNATTYEYVLNFACAQRPGLLHALTGLLVEFEGNIIELKQFDDPRSDRYFLRMHFSVPGDSPETVDAGLRERLTRLETDLGAEWSLNPHAARRRVLIMASKSDHCLNDLLYRSRVGSLPIEIAAVVSNHPDHRELIEWHGIPYFHVPVDPQNKQVAEGRLLELVEEYDVELVILARYMQILSDALTAELSGKAINIHHSFLPSFKGSKPYHQAFERGVKTIGATAHYVNEELDEGPIISQQVMQVDHAFGPEDLAAAGRDSECKALADAVKLHCESRVFVDGNRTIILR
ncbi:formyltetrahydrofolate deformylase [Rothia sp. AR01]|uniref:Formyltetrahydrofolate deformylase n=1 Tax=Rothia santali TaxID=2949643 RepID=A0A9X2HKE8_9MICC|nr:formyltetrahydrofolate deformylase [Rothia santali]MCP3426543.1 formyltetrahydrofolate deformylase [Rothia santali]